ncbi:MAG: translational GTPase TypA [Chitinophagales bacterium]|nr:translational GTPase TypA [Sphingobacteriales bacterium]
MSVDKIRNIAIIAHVDHGKTTLVDKMLHAAMLFRDNQQMNELILDNNDQERERGITILAKNVAVNWKGHKINIIDTPGHSDFGGEVERVLNMADGVLLLCDAFEGPMPQTRFVTQKALALGKKAIVIVNKVDKPNCTPEKAYEDVFDLFFNLEATQDQLDFKTIYGSAKQGWMSDDFNKPTDNVNIIFDTIISEIPCPKISQGNLQLQITSLDFSSYTGRIAVGRIERGTIEENQPISLMKADGSIKKMRTKEIYVFEGMGKVKVSKAEAGEIVAVTGIEDFEIGDTIADFEAPEALERIKIDEPTMSMIFTINNSPFFGKEGKFVTSRHIRERLTKELEKNLALRVHDTGSPDSFLVYGRGILHLSVLLETMRREGYELQVGQPQVIIKVIDGKKCEPIENLTVDVPEEFAGKIIELVSQRKGEMKAMFTKGDMQRLEFEIPTRGLNGFRSTALTQSGGEAIIAHRFKDYEPMKGEIPARINGVMISKETGMATGYSMEKLKDRGRFFIEPGDQIYAGQVIGEQIRPGDLVVNVCTAKQLTNFRAAGKDDNVGLPPKIDFSLEESMEYIEKDEYLELTPKSMRLRKIHLDENERKKAAQKAG